jgi:hypothetical protein
MKGSFQIDLWVALFIIVLIFLFGWNLQGWCITRSLRLPQRIVRMSEAYHPASLTFQDRQFRVVYDAALHRWQINTALIRNLSPGSCDKNNKGAFTTPNS